MDNTFKPFAIGDRVISQADGPGTIVEINQNSTFPVIALFDFGGKYDYADNGWFLCHKPDNECDIRHMTAEEQTKFPKPE